MIQRRATIDRELGFLRAHVWVGVGAMIFFREKLRTGFWLGLAVALAGVFIVMSDVSGKPVSFNTGTHTGTICGGFLRFVFSDFTAGKKIYQYASVFPDFVLFGFNDKPAFHFHSRTAVV